MPDAKKQEIDSVWIAQYGREFYRDDYKIDYYGTYGDCIVLFRVFMGMAPEPCCTIGVAGHEFAYGREFSILVYRDGAFLDLKDAYEMGYLTEEQIAFIADYHDEINYIPRKIPPVFGIDLPDEETVLDLQSEWRYKFGEHFHWGDNLVRYYGAYGDVIVLFDCSGERLAAVTELEVAGSKFVFGSSFSIYVYTGEYIDLEKAYQNGLLTEAQIAEIAEYHRIYEENRMAE